MEADFKIIVITPESILADEASYIETMLHSNVVWRVHIRHPRATIDEVDSILSRIPKHLHSRISLHDFYDLANKYNGLGVHLNARNIGAQVSPNMIVSKSCHSIDEVRQSRCNYVTLSPIFNSISKVGYCSAFDPTDENLCEAIRGKHVIALGGVKPEHFNLLRSAGFAGAALLGYVWSDDINAFDQRLKTISKYVAIHN